MWFVLAERHFNLAGIRSEQTKFCYVISKLDDSYARRVKNIILSPKERNPYSRLKAELVTGLSGAREQRIPDVFMFFLFSFFYLLELGQVFFQSMCGFARQVGLAPSQLIAGSVYMYNNISRQAMKK
jgi:hypothetical protein